MTSLERIDLEWTSLQQNLSDSAERWIGRNQGERDMDNGGRWHI